MLIAGPQYEPFLVRISCTLLAIVIFLCHTPRGRIVIVIVLSLTTNPIRLFPSSRLNLILSQKAQGESVVSKTATFFLSSSARRGPRRVLTYCLARCEVLRIVSSHVQASRLAVPGFRPNKAPATIAYRRHRNSCNAALIRHLRVHEESRLAKDLERAFTFPEYTALPWDGEVYFLIEVSYFERPGAPDPGHYVGGAARVATDPDVKLPIPGSITAVEELMPGNVVARMNRGDAGLGMSLPNASTAGAVYSRILPAQLTGSIRTGHEFTDGNVSGNSPPTGDRNQTTPSPADHVEIQLSNDFAGANRAILKKGQAGSDQARS
jgi:hypothetical protein